MNNESPIFFGKLSYYPKEAVADVVFSVIRIATIALVAWALKDLYISRLQWCSVSCCLLRPALSASSLWVSMKL